jgi:hypothetical protein
VTDTRSHPPTSSRSSPAATSPESAGNTVGTPLTRLTARMPGRENLPVSVCAQPQTRAGGRAEVSRGGNHGWCFLWWPFSPVHMTVQQQKSRGGNVGWCVLMVASSTPFA